MPKLGLADYLFRANKISNKMWLCTTNLTTETGVVICYVIKRHITLFLSDVEHPSHNVSMVNKVWKPNPKHGS